jgi:hypothetical protein
MKFEEKQTNCPNCSASLVGQPIAQEDLTYYGGATHYRREIGIEERGFYDGAYAWQCPDCQYRWDRLGTEASMQKVNDWNKRLIVEQKVKTWTIR